MLNESNDNVNTMYDINYCEITKLIYTKSLQSKRGRKKSVLEYELENPNVKQVIVAHYWAGNTCGLIFVALSDIYESNSQNMRVTDLF